MIIQSQSDIEALQKLGESHARVLKGLVDMVAPGVTTTELETRANELIQKEGGTPAFKGYKPHGAPRPFPCALCVAPNNTVVHGIPTEQNYTLKQGDIIGLDIGIVRDGYVIDAGKTVSVGVVDKEAQALLRTTYEALMRGVDVARAGNHIGDIGHTIETYIQKKGYGVVRELCGHGVGRALHEPPQVPNFGAKGTGALLEVGMVIAIEPMVNEGNSGVVFHDDGYTVTTRDGSRSAHFEHNIIIQDGDPIILTNI
jgi:methionyl aminopeptidase